MRNLAPALVTLFLLFSVGCASTESLQWSSSTDELLEFRYEITPQRLQTHLEFIAHDSLKGGDNGSYVLRMAANYLDSPPLVDNQQFIEITRRLAQ